MPPGAPPRAASVAGGGAPTSPAPGPKGSAVVRPAAPSAASLAAANNVLSGNLAALVPGSTGGAMAPSRSPVGSGEEGVVAVVVVGRPHAGTAHSDAHAPDAHDVAPQRLLSGDRTRAWPTGMHTHR